MHPAGWKASGMQTGRWNEQEHAVFLQGLQHGHSWTKIAETIGTRTAAQVRSHAQKYLAKMKKMYTVVVPPNHGPGMQFVIAVPDPAGGEPRRMMVTVPAGKTGGDTIMVRA